MILALLCVFAQTQFMLDVEGARMAFHALKKRTEAAEIAGDLAACQKAQLEAIPEDERKAAYGYVLGTMWSDLDPSFAYRMQEKAFALAPAENEIARAWAVELHRAGKYAEADGIYGRLMGSSEEAVAARGLRADCLLGLERYAEAADAWKGLSKEKRFEQALNSLSWLYHDESKAACRIRILGELKAGRTEHAEELVLGDVFWARAGTRYRVNENYMEHDLRIALEKLGPDTERAKDLEGVTGALFLFREQKIPPVDDTAQREKTEEVARKLGWIGDRPRLPSDDLVASAVVGLLRDVKLRTPEQLCEDFGDELAQRAAKATAPRDLAQTLVSLARNAGSPKVDEYKKLVKAEAKSLAHDAVIAARIAKKPLAKLLVAQIRAELGSQSPSTSALDKAFEELGKESGKPAATGR